MAVIDSFLMLATIFTVLGTNTSILPLIPEHLTKYSPSSAFRVYRKTQYLVLGTFLSRKRTQGMELKFTHRVRHEV